MQGEGKDGMGKRGGIKAASSKNNLGWNFLILIIFSKKIKGKMNGNPVNSRYACAYRYIDSRLIIFKKFF
jgi:hypothetical protein